MINKTTASVAAALLVGSAMAAQARAHHAPGHARLDAFVPSRSFAPARMIEVRPGLWVGSYQCIIDLDRGGRDCSSGS